MQATKSFIIGMLMFTFIFYEGLCQNKDLISEEPGYMELCYLNPMKQGEERVYKNVKVSLLRGIYKTSDVCISVAFVPLRKELINIKEILKNNKDELIGFLEIFFKSEKFRPDKINIILSDDSNLTENSVALFTTFEKLKQLSHSTEQASDDLLSPFFSDFSDEIKNEYNSLKDRMINVPIYGYHYSNPLFVTVVEVDDNDNVVNIVQYKFRVLSE
ncbi:MAG: hypothetical protein KatS3mg027_2340 [Bacteroidia bacterium]|nr:MAG: hypothetical protein KatS3mg027_2340 [Bacteroidia bacterium]